MQELLIRKIKGGMMGIKTGTKTPEEVIGLLTKLRDVNEGMYEELMAQYIKLVKPEA